MYVILKNTDQIQFKVMLQFTLCRSSFSYFFHWELFWARFPPNLNVFDNNGNVAQVCDWLKIVEIFNPTQILLSYFRSIFLLYIPENSKVSEGVHVISWKFSLHIFFHPQNGWKIFYLTFRVWSKVYEKHFQTSAHVQLPITISIPYRGKKKRA